MSRKPSIWSFKDRGPWGNAKYRGNCSGHVVRELIESLRPKTFIDPCVGSGTSIEVADEMGVRAIGLDLRFGFNVLRDSIRAAAGLEADLCFSHPPYFSMILYSGNVYDGAHPDDLSRCEDVEDFNEKMQQMLLNQRDATVPGGYYATLIGDQRQAGRYYSYQAECIARMPRDELRGVIIKAQHNCMSDFKTYNGSPGLPWITHEYLLVWQKPKTRSGWWFALRTISTEAHARVRSTWTGIVRQALVSLGGKATLKELYERVMENAPERAESNSNIDAKVRQVLQRHPAQFQRVDRGVWSLAA